jgi:hypothetical protein
MIGAGGLRCVPICGAEQRVDECFHSTRFT